MARKHEQPPKPPEDETEAALDEMVEESFPASDPPAFAGGIKAGGPKRKNNPPSKAVES